MNISILFCGNNINNRPRLDLTMNWMDSFNELSYYLILLFSLCFTMYNPDMNARESIGNIVNYLLLSMMMANAALISYT